jgi:hypothetical protein
MSPAALALIFIIKDKLVAGTVSNMYTIVEKMNGARNTIKL